ncbi:MAG: aminoglycoside phosphotransferase (APT) family kinase protein [Hyphomicrobiaceae bacterium]|jgi:aminoglycoside phosphotransferase (APT) family kinase protein
MSALDLTEPLQNFLARTCDGPVAVRDFRTLTGGASAAVYAFTLGCQGEADRALVLRMDADNGGGVMGAARDSEFALLAAASRAGVTVPSVYWQGTADDGLPAPFFIMDLVEGEAIARHLLRDQRYEKTRGQLPDDLARELVRVHDIDLADPQLGFLAEAAAAGDDPRRHAWAEIARYTEVLDTVGSGDPYPLLRLVARWLADNAPEVERACLVHGDFRIGNIMFDEGGLTSVLDWELCHTGDPVEDLGWLCVRAWRFGVDGNPVGGLCDREALLKAYANYGGATVDPAHLRYWEIFGNWRWAIICIFQAARHKMGDRLDVELATIGRRVADSEWEILELMEEG